MGIKAAIKEKIRTWLDDGAVSASGPEVFTGAMGVLTVENTPAFRTALLMGMAGEVGRARLERAEGDAWKLKVHMHGMEVGSEGPLAAQTKAFNKWVKTFKGMVKGGSTFSGGMFRWVALILVFLAALAWMGLRQQNAAASAGIASADASVTAISQTNPVAQLAAQIQPPPRSTSIPLTMPSSGDLPGAADEDKIFPIRQLDEIKLREVKTANTLEMRSEGKPFYVFSNPTCSACQHLEAELAKLQPGVKPLIIPVAFDADGMRLGTQVMCSQDPVAAWKNVMSGAKIDTPLCMDGLKRMERNSNLFAAMEFTATPTIVAGDGRGSIGSVSSGVLAAWLDGAK